MRVDDPKADYGRMNTMKSWTRPLIAILMASIITLACNLTAEAPPTLVPQQPLSTLTPQNPFGPQGTIQAPPVTNEPLPSGYTTSVPDNPSIAQHINQIDSDRMMNTIRTLVGFENRHAFSEPALDRGIYAAQNWIMDQLRGIQQSYPNTRIDVYTQPFAYQYSGESFKAENIIMVMNGLDGSAGAVLVGAHYDTTGSIITQGSGLQPGANDNGSGVAAVLEIARIVAQTPRRATVVFIFFSAEEQGRFGSKAFARDFIRAQNIPLRATLNLDIIGNPVGLNGNRYDFQMRVFSAPPNDSESRQLARLAEFVTRRYVPDMQVNVMPTIDRNGRWGDHESFSENGYPAVRLIEQEDNPLLAHNSSDTITHIEPNYLRRTTQVALATLLVVADGPNPPALRQMDTSNWTLEWSPVSNAQGYVVALRSPGSLEFDLEITVASTSMSWASFPNYEAVAVAAVDATGKLGPFSREQLIQPVPFQ